MIGQPLFIAFIKVKQQHPGKWREGEEQTVGSRYSEYRLPQTPSLFDALSFRMEAAIEDCGYNRDHQSRDPEGDGIGDRRDSLFGGKQRNSDIFLT